MPIPVQNAPVSFPFMFTIPPTAIQDKDNDPLNYVVQCTNGNPITSYTWLTYNSATLTFTGTPLAAARGTYDIKITADDGLGLSAFTTF